MGIQEDIDVLENKVARLKVEYEQYFLHVVKQPPSKLRDEVERLVLAYHGKNITSSSHKFRLNNVVSKFNTYRNYWNRALRSIEEGTFNRRAEGGMGITSAPVAPPASPGQEPKQNTEPTPAARQQGQDRPAAPTPAPAAASGADDIYNRYIAARKECNESTSGITPEALSKSVDEFKKKVMAQYNAKDVDVKVAVKDGKARLIIVPKK